MLIFEKKETNTKTKKMNVAITTQEQLRRALVAKSDTERLLSKEKSYSEDLQKKHIILLYESHLVKINSKIDEYNKING